MRGLFVHPGRRSVAHPIAAQLASGFPLDLGQVVDGADARRRFRPGRPAILSRASSTSGRSRRSRIRSWRRSRPGPIRTSARSRRPSPFPTTSARSLTPWSTPTAWGLFLERTTAASTRHGREHRRLDRGAGRGLRRHDQQSPGRCRMARPPAASPRRNSPKSSPTRGRPSRTPPIRPSRPTG